MKKIIPMFMVLLCSVAVAEVVSLDISDGFNYDAFISDAEANHAYLYDPPANWSLGGRMVYQVFGENYCSTAAGRSYAWQAQVPTGYVGLPDSGEITTDYGTFEFCTDLDAEPIGGFTQIAAPTTPTGLLPIASNAVRVYRPHTGSTGNPLASKSLTLPTDQQDYYDSINFIVSGSNGTVLIYADYDDGNGGLDTELVYTSPDTPGTTSETGFPDILSSSTTNTDITEISSYQMNYYWSQASNYSLVRLATTRLWTLDDAIALDSSKKLMGLTVAIYDVDTWHTRTAFFYAACANKVDPTYYVDATDGDDDTGDGSQSNPWATLDKALDECDERDTIILEEGEYDAILLQSAGGITPIFSDWVTVKAADGADVEIKSITVSAYGTSPADPDQDGTYDVYIRFEGLHVTDGVQIDGGRHWALVDCLVENEGPYTGTAAIMDYVVAISFRNGTDILIQDCEATNVVTAVEGRGHDITVRGCYFHDGSHDGIRVCGWWDSIIEDTTICRFDDGVTDAEATWSRHCDLIHIFIPGNGADGMQNHNVVIRNCRLYDTEAMGIQFNNYYATNDTVHNEQILIENCVFGPTHANQINNGDPADGLIIRSCTSVVLDSARTFGRWTLENYIWRIGSTSTGVEIYNNLMGSCSPPATAEILLFDWNAMQLTPSTNPSADETGRALGRFTYLGLDPDFVNPTDFTGEIGSNTEVDDLGTVLNAPDDIYPYGINGVVRDNRPDLGAWELAGHSPAVEPVPTEYNDTKSIFVDDFEDGSYTDVDPWLEDQYTLGLSWGNPASATMMYMLMTDLSTDNNVMKSPIAADKMAWLICDQGSDWADYDFSFSAKNAYVTSDTGVMLLTQDEDNYYWLDIGRDTGDLYRVISGTATLLSSDNDIKLPHSGWRDYKVSVSHGASGEIIISVDADNDGDTELTYTDSNATAISTFTSGTVGFHTEFASANLHVQFDDVLVDVSEFDN